MRKLLFIPICICMLLTELSASESKSQLINDKVKIELSFAFEQDVLFANVTFHNHSLTPIFLNSSLFGDEARKHEDMVIYCSFIDTELGKFTPLHFISNKKIIYKNTGNQQTSKHVSIQPNRHRTQGYRLSGRYSLQKEGLYSCSFNILLPLDNKRKITRLYSKNTPFYLNLAERNVVLLR